MEREDPSADGSDDTADGTADDTEASGWTFGEADAEGDFAETATEADRAPDERRGSVAGGTDRRLPVEPESIDPENAFFVLLGVVVTLAVFAQFVVG